MDREAIARTHRRRQATDALDFERDRAAALQEEIEQLVAELESGGVDEAAFARMAPEDVQVVRSVLNPGEDAPEEAEEGEWLVFPDDPPEPEIEPIDPRAEGEAEIARLEEELADSRRRQEALERYLEALES